MNTATARRIDVAHSISASVIIIIIVLVVLVISQGVVKQLLALLANDWLLVATLNVVPLDSILNYHCS